MKELILLNMAEGIGSIRTKALLDYFKATENIFKASAADLMQVTGIGRKLAENILNVAKDGNLLLEREFNLIKKHNVKVITIFDKDYPINLKQIHDPPIVLYVKGQLETQDKLAVAIVGSRKCSHYGRMTAERLAGELSGYGITVVSGMARGIDTAAHCGTLRAKGRTIAVLGSGLLKIYPPENRRLSEEIAEDGAVVSEFPLTAGPLAENFPRRNRVISGLSLGVVVVEAAKDSGALITARCAAEQGREVFSVPGQVHSESAAGTNQLIKDGAKLVENAKDIIEELSVEIKALLKKMGTVPDLKSQHSLSGTVPIFSHLGKDELKIFEALKDTPLYIDDIAQNSQFPIAKTSSVLTAMEIKGLVKRMPGNVFSRI
jgi:DNA processing protein